VPAPPDSFKRLIVLMRISSITLKLVPGQLSRDRRGTPLRPCHLLRQPDKKGERRTSSKYCFQSGQLGVVTAPARADLRLLAAVFTTAAPEASSVQVNDRLKRARRHVWCRLQVLPKEVQIFYSLHFFHFTSLLFRHCLSIV
jgi:hypothetical protein